MFIIKQSIYQPKAQGPVRISHPQPADLSSPEVGGSGAILAT